MTAIKRLYWALPLVTLCAFSVYAQDSVTVTEAELSIPFGVAEGRLVTVANQLVFIDEEDPDESFALRKGSITAASADGGVLIIRTSEPIGGVSEFTFRIENGEAEEVATWIRSPGPPPRRDTAPRRGQTETTGVIGEYRVSHDHLFGDCEGILRVTRDGIAYQSVTQSEHSVRWNISDIEELGRPDRDALRVNPFDGSEYDFEFIGERLMSQAEFRALSDRVARSRFDSGR